MCEHYDKYFPEHEDRFKSSLGKEKEEEIIRISRYSDLQYTPEEQAIVDGWDKAVKNPEPFNLIWKDNLRTPWWNKNKSPIDFELAKDKEFEAKMIWGVDPIVNSQSDPIEEEFKKRYFTPSIEDIRVGYIGEYSPKDKIWQEFLVRPETDLKFLLSKPLRTPYLTKSQIEAEGWIIKEGLATSSGIPILFKGNYGVILYFKDPTKPIIEFWIKDPTAISFDYHSPEHIRWVFPCPSINEFRYITKLLNI